MTMNGRHTTMRVLHSITTVEETNTENGTELTRECECGWVTIGTVPEPAHHVPLAQREADHLADAAAIEDGSVWHSIPEHAGFRLHLRRRLRTQEPNEVVITAVWTSNSQEVLIWPWTAAGLAEAQEWCDKNYTTWAKTGYPVQPASLAAHANA